MALTLTDALCHARRADPRARGTTRSRSSRDLQVQPADQPTVSAPVNGRRPTYTKHVRGRAGAYPALREPLKVVHIEHKPAARDHAADHDLPHSVAGGLYQ